MSSPAVPLRLNAASCLGFGALFALAPVPVAVFLGDPPALVIRLLGLALVVNGAHLMWAARRPVPCWPEVVWFSLGDFAWWLGTLAVIATGVWITMPAGIAAALAVGFGVAGLGIAQLFALGRARTGLSARGLWGALGQSWMALPDWVKVWLTALNLVFLAAMAFWPAPMAVVPLLAYAASGPLLLGMAAAQGGLTRALGVAHLVPWVPLLAWLIPRVGLGDAAALYAMLLAATVALCLTFDAWDLIRYARGERGVMGAARPRLDGAEPSG